MTSKKWRVFGRVDQGGSAMLDLTRFIASCRGYHREPCDGRLHRGLISALELAKPAGDRDLGVNPYGCADAANILYTIGRFPAESAERSDWVEVLQSLQDPEIGSLHRGRRTTRFIRPLTASLPSSSSMRVRFGGFRARQLKTPDAVRAFLAGLDWRANPWRRVAPRCRPVRRPRHWRTRSMLRLAGRLFRLAVGQHRAGDRR